MEIKFFCPHWGATHLDFTDFIRNVKTSGYDGVEMSLPLHQVEKRKILQILNDHELLFIAQHWETNTANFEDHKIEYRQRLVNLAMAKPLFINSQTGKDFFTFDQNAELIAIATDVSCQYGIKIIHETHRGKFSFAAHVTAEYLTRLPNLQLGFGVSHWCSVAESYLADQQENIELAISRAVHVHARVGFPEGPQIPDPRVPEWEEAVNIHLAWWKRIVEKNRAEGREVFTITSEFGPFPYMTILPFTKQPISNQWDINVYMMNLLKSEFNR